MKWEEGSITIRGQDVQVRTGMIEHVDLTYFVDNPRIYSVVRADGATPNQDEIQNRLWKMDHVKDLRLDIEQNGGLIDPIIVKGGTFEVLEGNSGTFEVLEGNSRLAAYRKLSITDPIKWGKIKCTMLPRDIEESLVFALLGQYHIKGKKDWTPYEQAGFLYRRHIQHGIGITELGTELGIGQNEAGKLIRVYKCMLDNDDTDTSRWSHYYALLSSTKLKKLSEKYPGFREIVIKGIKSGDIDRAADIRDKLSKIPVSKKRIVNDFVAGKINIDEAYERVVSSGSMDATYAKINKFRVWFGSEETAHSLKGISAEARQKIDFELKKLAKYTTRLQGIISK